MSDKPVIGFIGLGYMGHGMAKNILKGGYPLQVKGHRNRAPVESLVAMGAVEAASPKAMAEASDIIHLCLSNSPQVEAVIRGPDGILAGARPGLIVIDTTTADPTSTLALAAEMAAEGVTLVDAPLGRTPKEAEAGTLDAMVGAEEAVFEAVRPVINCWAGTVTRIGLAGSRLPNAALASGKGLPGTVEAGDQLGATLGTAGDSYIMEEDGSTSLLIGVPGEDRGTVTDSGWVVFSRYSMGVPPRSIGLQNPAIAGEQYGRVLAR